MNSYSVGIMQGRLLPEDLDVLQIFPKKKWFEEIDTAKNLGFNHIELLWDSKKEIKNAINIKKSFCSLPEPFSKSICVHSICECISIDEVLGEVLDVLNFFEEKIPKVIIIPLLGNIKFKSEYQLREFIFKFYQHNLLNLIKLYKVKIALEINLSANQILHALKFDPLNIFGICIDSGNLWQYSESPIQEIQMLSNKILHVHIKDKDKNGNNVLLGEGLVNFFELFNALKKINYIDILTLETKYFNNPVLEAKKNLLYILNIIAKK